MSSSRKRTLAKIGFFYGLTGLGDSLIWQLMSSWQTYFYLPPDGTALIPVGVLFGVLMALNTATDVIITIPIGYWSDHHRTRWGRRLPWMFLAGLPRLLFFMLLWLPPSQSTSLKNLLYLSAILVVHGIIAGFQQVPNNALLPELATGDQDRLVISSWAGSLRLFGVILSGAAGVFIGRWGYFVAMGFYALVSMLCFYLPFLVLREPEPVQKETPDNNIIQPRLTIRQSLTLALKNRAFLLMLAIHALSTGSRVLVQVVFPFIITEILFLSTGDTVYFYIIGVLFSFVSYPLVPWFNKRLGKHRTFSAVLLATAIVMPGLLLLGNDLPLPVLIPGILWVIMEAVVMAMSLTLEYVFIAEIIDRDAETLGERREGIFYGAMDSVDSIVYGIAGALPTLILLLGRGQEDASGPLGVRMVGVLSGVLSLLAFLVFRRYPIRPAQESAKGVL